MKTKEEILFKTLNEMPRSFTSNAFNQRAINNGYPLESLRKQGLAYWLRKYVDNAYYGSKTWTKRTKITDYPSTTNLRENDLFSIQNDDVEKAIRLLKAKGYKILKTIEI